MISIGYVTIIRLIKNITGCKAPEQNKYNNRRDIFSGYFLLLKIEYRPVKQYFDQPGRVCRISTKKAESILRRLYANLRHFTTKPYIVIILRIKTPEGTADELSRGILFCIPEATIQVKRINPHPDPRIFPVKVLLNTAF